MNTFFTRKQKIFDEDYVTAYRTYASCCYSIQNGIYSAAASLRPIQPDIIEEHRTWAVRLRIVPVAETYIDSVNVSQVNALILEQFQVDSPFRPRIYQGYIRIIIINRCRCSVTIGHGHIHRLRIIAVYVKITALSSRKNSKRQLLM